jgi:hypothetical protein
MFYPSEIFPLMWLARLESVMTEPSESTKLEGSHGFSEYAGSGKLKGKNALITAESMWSKFTRMILG